MKLKRVKRITYGLYGLTLASMLLIWVNLAFKYVPVGILIANYVFQIIFWRCPYCGESLGRAGNYCRHCGSELDWK